MSTPISSNPFTDGEAEDGSPGGVPPVEALVGSGGDTLTPVQEALLRNPTRRAILQAVHETPGLNKSQLSEAVDLLPNALQFQAARLEDESLLVTKPSPRENEILCFLPVHEELWETEDVRVLYGRSSTRDVAIYLAEHPGMTTREAAGALELAESSVVHHLNKLIERDLGRRLRLGRDVEYHPTTRLEGWVAEVGTAYEVPWTEG